MGVVGGDEVGAQDKDDEGHYKGGDAHGEVPGPVAHQGHGVAHPAVDRLPDAVQGAVDKVGDLLGEIGQHPVQPVPHGGDAALERLPDHLPVLKEGADFREKAVAQGEEEPSGRGKGQQNEQQGEKAPGEPQPLLEQPHQGIEQPGHHQGQDEGHEKTQQRGDQVAEKQHEEHGQHQPDAHTHPQPAPVTPG